MTLDQDTPARPGVDFARSLLHDFLRGTEDTLDQLPAILVRDLRLTTGNGLLPALIVATLVITMFCTLMPEGGELALLAWCGCAIPHLVSMGQGDYGAGKEEPLRISPINPRLWILGRAAGNFLISLTITSCVLPWLIYKSTAADGFSIGRGLGLVAANVILLALNAVFSGPVNVGAPSIMKRMMTMAWCIGALTLPSLYATIILFVIDEAIWMLIPFLWLVVSAAMARLLLFWMVFHMEWRPEWIPVKDRVLGIAGRIWGYVGGIGIVLAIITGIMGLNFIAVSCMFSAIFMGASAFALMPFVSNWYPAWRPLMIKTVKANRPQRPPKDPTPPTPPAPVTPPDLPATTGGQ